MLKPKSTTTSTNGNGTAPRMPKASDFKLPKRLTKAQKEMIEATHALFKAIREDHQKNGKVRKR